MAIAAAAKAILGWAMRGTKQLSPYSSKYVTMAKGKKSGFHQGVTVKGFAKERPWFQKVTKGEDSWLGKMGVGETGRARFATGYKKSYKHLRKHKKLYGSGVAGAAIWDFLPGKDNV